MFITLIVCCPICYQSVCQGQTVYIYTVRSHHNYYTLGAPRLADYINVAAINIFNNFVCTKTGSNNNNNFTPQWFDLITFDCEARYEMVGARARTKTTRKTHVQKNLGLMSGHLFWGRVTIRTSFSRIIFFRSTTGNEKTNKFHQHFWSAPI